MRRFDSDPCLHRNPSMEPFKQEWEDFRARRFRVVKKWLRYFPTRATLRKSFIFRKFGGVLLNKMPQLWSFAYKPMRNAYYAGWIMTWWPVMGIQIPLATILTVLFKGNLLLTTALQFVSNPLTLPLMYPLEFYVGKQVVSWFPLHAQWLQNASLKGMLTAVKSGSWEQLLSIGLGGFVLCCIGGTLIGCVCAFVSCKIHKRIIKNSMMNYEQFVAMKRKQIKELKEWK